MCRSWSGSGRFSRSSTSSPQARQPLLPGGLHLPSFIWSTPTALPGSHPEYVLLVLGSRSQRLNPAADRPTPALPAPTFQVRRRGPQDANAHCSSSSPVSSHSSLLSPSSLPLLPLLPFSFSSPSSLSSLLLPTTFFPHSSLSFSPSSLPLFPLLSLFLFFSLLPLLLTTPPYYFLSSPPPVLTKRHVFPAGHHAASCVTSCNCLRSPGALSVLMGLVWSR